MNKKNDSFINSRKMPDIPKGWTIVEHIKIKSFFWNRKSAVLCREKEQENRQLIYMKTLRRLK